MKNKLVLASLILGLPFLGLAQSTPPNHPPRPSQHGNTGSASPASNNGAAPAAAGWSLSSQTKIQAKLKSRLDTRHARVGQQVQAVTTSSVKSQGRVVLPKGTRLYGRITQVQAAANSHARSSLGVLFSEAVTRQGRRIPIHASIMQVLAGSSEMQAGFTPPPMAQPMGVGGGGAMSAGGGLVGGAGGALGGAVNSGTQIAGNVGAGLGAQTSAMTGGMLRASNGAAFHVLPVRAEGNSQSSLLVAPHGNLVLNSGTNMVLVTGPASASAASSTSAQASH